MNQIPQTKWPRTAMCQRSHLLHQVNIKCIYLTSLHILVESQNAVALCWINRPCAALQITTSRSLTD